VNFAYTWAFANPARKVYCNLTITGPSVAVSESKRKPARAIEPA